MTDERYWRVPELAERLRVDPETVRRWLRAGKLRGVLLSQQGGYRIPDSEVRRFIAERLGHAEAEQARVSGVSSVDSPHTATPKLGHPVAGGDTAIIPQVRGEHAAAREALARGQVVRDAGLERELGR